jgi:hypothetical protein
MFHNTDQVTLLPVLPALFYRSENWLLHPSSNTVMVTQAMNYICCVPEKGDSCRAISSVGAIVFVCGGVWVSVVRSTSKGNEAVGVDGVNDGDDVVLGEAPRRKQVTWTSLLIRSSPARCTLSSQLNQLPTQREMWVLDRLRWWELWITRDTQNFLFTEMWKVEHVYSEVPVDLLSNNATYYFTVFAVNWDFLLMNLRLNRPLC